ncbi:hypothetical protein AVEN_151399-1 [Araneus ventricosus]|uniref:Uncharacterized protein n=1 Tax=Araneus ventricosus TaxID=182803 RepID=A0A4Y2CB35_ARAVE|nr:hypothetical protein AVEN_151399-1 [Araneus ventricosus]
MLPEVGKNQKVFKKKKSNKIKTLPSKKFLVVGDISTLEQTVVWLGDGCSRVTIMRFSLHSLSALSEELHQTHGSVRDALSDTVCHVTNLHITVPTLSQKKWSEEWEKQLRGGRGG